MLHGLPALFEPSGLVVVASNSDIFKTLRRWRRGAPSLSNNLTRMAVCSTHFKRSEEHTSELQSLMRISYAVFCLKKKRSQEAFTKETDITVTQHDSQRYNQYSHILLY